jgi:hypothetical protein
MFGLIIDILVNFFDHLAYLADLETGSDLKVSITVKKKQTALFYLVIAHV